MLTQEAVQALRLQRQGLAQPLGAEEYDLLFRDLSPVAPVYWSRPGSAPQLVFRAGFDQLAYNEGLRARRGLVKARFQKGNIGYVLREELGLYAALYRRPAAALTPAEEQVLALLRREGPMSVHQMMEFTGLRAKELTPALHRLQQRFAVFEDQVDDGWDRCWYLPEEFLPEWEPEAIRREEALGRVLLRMARRCVWFTCAMAKALYQLPAREIATALAALEQAGALAAWEGGYLLPEDRALLQARQWEAAPCVYLLHRSDYLVNVFESQLKDAYRPAPGQQVLYYLLVDGVFRGAVTGQLKQGPFVLEDLLLDLPPSEALSRQAEVLAAVYRVNDPVHSPLARYCGQPLG